MGSTELDLTGRIVDAKLYIETCYDQKISLNSISRYACLSKFHFHRVFKECYGSTPLEYLTRIRIEAAKSLLQDGSSTIEACHTVGFESVSSFIKLFKKKERVTPSVYARSLKKQRLNAAIQPLNYIPTCYAEYLGWADQ